MALQIMGVSGSASMSDAMMGAESRRFDIRVWVWKEPWKLWDIKGVDTRNSIFGELSICRDPRVEGLLLEINDKYQLLYYPTYLLDDELYFIELMMNPLQDKAFVSNCKESYGGGTGRGKEIR